MRIRGLLAVLFIVSAFSQMAYAATLLETLHSFKPPLTLLNALVSNEQNMIEIDLTDSEHHHLKFTMGGRPPSTLLEMFNSAPRNEIVLRPQSAAFDGVTLPIGSADEKQILQFLEDWKASGSVTVQIKGDKNIPVSTGAAERRRKLVDRVISILKARNPPALKAGRRGSR
jgi:hypothetical protein